jgi:hypothetical protein
MAASGRVSRRLPDFRDSPMTADQPMAAAFTSSAM